MMALREIPYKSRQPQSLLIFNLLKIKVKTIPYLKNSCESEHPFWMMSRRQFIYLYIVTKSLKLKAKEKWYGW